MEKKTNRKRFGCSCGVIIDMNTDNCKIKCLVCGKLVRADE